MSVGTAAPARRHGHDPHGAIAKGEDPALVDRAVAADEERRRLLGDVDGMRAQRKDISRQVGAAMKAGGAGADELKARVDRARHAHRSRRATPARARHPA